jgi:hypothetical protein
MQDIRHPFPYPFPQFLFDDGIAIEIPIRIGCQQPIQVDTAHRYVLIYFIREAVPVCIALFPVACTDHLYIVTLFL